MNQPSVVGRSFFARPALEVARSLLGQHLLRQIDDGPLLRGKIVETEAYVGPDDTACHAHKGRTARTEVMFGQAGIVYVYLIYGIHSMLNFVTDHPDFPAAVLIRAVEPLEGIPFMRAKRQVARKSGSATPIKTLSNGPGKLCQAFAIDQTLNGWDSTSGQMLWLETASPSAEKMIKTGPRVGIDYAAPQDREAPYRFWINDNKFVSPIR